MSAVPTASPPLKSWVHTPCAPQVGALAGAPHGPAAPPAPVQDCAMGAITGRGPSCRDQTRTASPIFCMHEEPSVSHASGPPVASSDASIWTRRGRSDAAAICCVVGVCPARVRVGVLGVHPPRSASIAASAITRQRRSPARRSPALRYARGLIGSGYEERAGRLIGPQMGPAIGPSPLRRTSPRLRGAEAISGSVLETGPMPRGTGPGQPFGPPYRAEAIWEPLSGTRSLFCPETSGLSRKAQRQAATSSFSPVISA